MYREYTHPLPCGRRRFYGRFDGRLAPHVALTLAYGPRIANSSRITGLRPRTEDVMYREYVLLDVDHLIVFSNDIE